MIRPIGTWVPVCGSTTSAAMCVMKPAPAGRAGFAVTCCSTE